jgi:3-isopropylmalate dehydratase small subunit
MRCFEENMKKNKILKIKLSEDVAKKFAVVGENEKMTLQNEVIQMIRQKISYYERVKGNIKKEALDSANMTEYIDEE